MELIIATVQFPVTCTMNWTVSIFFYYAFIQFLLNKYYYDLYCIRGIFHETIISTFKI